MKSIQVIYSAAGMGGMMDGITQGATGVMQMGMGIANAVRANKAKKEMESNTPSESDVRQTDIVAGLKSKRLSQQTGSELNQYNNTINAGLSGARNASMAMAGGNTGTMLAALAGSQATADNTMNQLAATTEKNAIGTQVLENAAMDNVIQRKMDVQMLKYNTANATYNSEKKAAQSNLAQGGANIIGGAGSMISGGGGGGGGGGKGAVAGAGAQAATAAGSGGGGTGEAKKKFNFPGID